MDTNDRAADYVAQEEGGFRHYFHYLRTLEAKRNMMDATRQEREAFVAGQVNEALEDQVIAGDADTVLDKLIAYRDEVGPFGRRGERRGGAPTPTTRWSCGSPPPRPWRDSSSSCGCVGGLLSPQRQCHDHSCMWRITPLPSTAKQERVYAV